MLSRKLLLSIKVSVRGYSRSSCTALISWRWFFKSLDLKFLMHHKGPKVQKRVKVFFSGECFYICRSYTKECQISSPIFRSRHSTNTTAQKHSLCFKNTKKWSKFEAETPMKSINQCSFLIWATFQNFSPAVEFYQLGFKHQQDLSYVFMNTSFLEDETHHGASPVSTAVTSLPSCSGPCSLFQSHVVL